MKKRTQFLIVLAVVILVVNVPSDGDAPAPQPRCPAAVDFDGAARP